MTRALPLLLLTALLSSAGRAELPTTDGAPAAASARVEEARVLALSPLVLDRGDLQVRGRFGQLELTIPLEDGAKATGASLRLAYHSAPVLLSERSRLSVALNGTALAELPLSPRRGTTRVALELPPEELHAGNNTLTFSAWQEHRDGCSLELVRDLWTRIDPTNSYLALTVERADAPLLLSGLGAPDWPIGRTGGAVSILTTEPVDDDLWLQTGALVAQGLALRLGEPGLIFDHLVLGRAAGAPAGTAALALLAGGPGDVPPGHHVLIGTFDQLLPTLGLEIGARIKGPYVGVHRLGENPEGAVLVVSGLSEEDVRYAALALANPAFELPPAPFTPVDEAPPVAPASRHYVQAGRLQTLEQWSAPDATRSAGLTRRTSFALLLPPDFYVADNRKAELRVNYGYKPNLGQGTALHVIVNGQYAGLINLPGDRDGGIVEGQTVRLPLRLFRPGRNTLDFEPALANADAIACAQVQDGGPSVGVFGDSTLRLPTVSEVVSQPDLGLFASLGYPYAPTTDGIAGVVVTSYDSASVAAGWTLVAQLAQTAGAPLPAQAVSFSAGEERGHVLMVGPLESIDPRVLARTPLARVHLRGSEPGEVLLQVASPPPQGTGGIGAVGTAFAADAGNLDDRASWERRIGRPIQPPGGPFGRLAAVLDRLVEDVSRTLERLLPQAWRAEGMDAAPRFLGDPETRFDGVAVAIASPFAPRRTATVITAADAPALQRAVATLVQPTTWHALEGDISAWAIDRPGVAAAQMAPRFPVQDPPAGLRQRVLYWNSYFAEHPGFWMVLVLGAIVALAAVTRIGLRRRHG